MTHDAYHGKLPWLSHLGVMLTKLSLQNVGPAERMEMNISQGFNIITGDNGVGKSFLLDVIWWALTRQWPQEVNPGLVCGKQALPSQATPNIISAVLSGQKKSSVSLDSTYDRKNAAWSLPKGRPPKHGLVVYAMVDGSFAVWDPARNYWRHQDEGASAFAKQPAYVFTPSEVWNGKDSDQGERLCNGLISDWRDWFLENNETFACLQRALHDLSPDGEPLEIVGLARVGTDSRRIPTLNMPYTRSKENAVPLTLASSAIKRVAALAYLLVWAWTEHVEACARAREKVTSGVTLLVDEIEAHLHPRWQRTILGALRSVVQGIVSARHTPLDAVQMIVTTHSPLVMASCEDFFDPAHDKWLDLDITDQDVVLTERFFARQGDADSWLMSEAFDLTSARSAMTEKLLAQAAELMRLDSPDPAQIEELQHKLESAIPHTDSFWFQWRLFIAGLIKERV